MNPQADDPMFILHSEEHARDEYEGLLRPPGWVDVALERMYHPNTQWEVPEDKKTLNRFF